MHALYMYKSYRSCVEVTNNNLCSFVVALPPVVSVQGNSSVHLMFCSCLKL